MDLEIESLESEIELRRTSHERRFDYRWSKGGLTTWPEGDSTTRRGRKKKERFDCLKRSKEGRRIRLLDAVERRKKDSTT